MAERRRAPGEGALYQRADGKWEASLHVGYATDGKRVRRKAVARTKKEAGERLAALRRDAESGLEPEAARWTVADWLERWLETESKPSVRPRTHLMYQAAVRNHLIPALGRHPLRSLTATHVKAYMGVKAEAGLAPQTIRNQHATLRRALAIAVRYGYVEKNVAGLVSPPKVRRDEVNPLTPDEVRQFLGAAQGHRQEALFVLAASTGMRLAEVLGVTWGSVDLGAGTVRVEQTLVRYEREFHLDPPKTRQSKRTIAIPGHVVEALRAHRVRQVEDKLKAPLWVNDWDLVFTDEVGRPVESRGLHDEFVGLLDRAKVRRVRFHDLRHGAATYLLAQGVPMKVVQDVLGHSQISMTADLYSHVVPELRRDAADRMGDVLFGS